MLVGVWISWGLTGWYQSDTLRGRVRGALIWVGSLIGFVAIVLGMVVLGVVGSRFGF